METIFGTLMFFISSLTKTAVLGVSTQEPLPNEVLEITQPVKTLSLFEEKFATEEITIKNTTIYKDDPETEADEEKILEEGENGKKITTHKITYYKQPATSDDNPASGGDSHGVKQEVEEQYSKELVLTKIIEPRDKVILRGTKIVWKKLETPDGEINYWKKMRVYATHYDQHCPGCNEWTAIGMRAGKGVIAVDPKVIKLRSKVYIPGYGIAIAGDTGGAIKGNIIDLGFDDARTAGWKAQYIDIYLL